MKHLIILITLIGFTLSSQAQKMIKMYFYTETEHTYTHLNNGDGDWKSGVPNKYYIRLITEPFDIPEDKKYDLHLNHFYDFLMTKYPEELQKMKGHRAELRLTASIYDPNNPSYKRDYESLFEKDPRASWNWEPIVVKGFKFDPKKQGCCPLSPLAKKAEALVKGL